MIIIQSSRFSRDGDLLMDFFNDLVILLTTFSLKEARGSTEDNRIWAIDTSSDKKIRIRILDLKLTSTPIRAWEVKLEIMTLIDQRNRLIDRQTDGHEG